MKRLVLSAAILLSIAVPAYARNTRPLFVIERNATKNVVQYEAQLTREGSLDPKEPVIAYWVMLSNGGHWGTHLRETSLWFTISQIERARLPDGPAGDKEREIRVPERDKVTAEI
jgi:hypothetical protein